MPAQPGPPYRVVWSERIREAVRRMSRKALQIGLGKQLLSALKHITQALALEPLAWGDPYFRMKASRLVLHHGTRWPVHVYYGVHEERPLVLVKDILPLPGSGLDD